MDTDKMTALIAVLRALVVAEKACKKTVRRSLAREKYALRDKLWTEAQDLAREALLMGGQVVISEEVHYTPG